MKDDCRRIIIDTDPGIDDAHCILVFLEAEKLNLVKIEAITVTRGNTSIENGCKNVVRLLELTNRTDIPVYKGVANSILCHHTKEDTYFGKDGLGDLSYDSEPDLSIIKSKPSPLAIKEIIDENPGEITLVCIAPLTNIALAATLYDDLSQKVKEIFIMGGNYRGRGNVTATAEFNFHFDPESAFMFFKKITCPTTILPFEACADSGIDVNWRMDVLQNDTDELKFLTKMEKSFFKFKVDDRTKWVPYDLIIPFAMFYPELVVEKNEYHVTVELHGGLTRAQMILDHLKKNKPNAVVIEKINTEYFKELLLKFHKVSK